MLADSPLLQRPAPLWVAPLHQFLPSCHPSLCQPRVPAEGGRGDPGGRGTLESALRRQRGACAHSGARTAHTHTTSLACALHRVAGCCIRSLHPPTRNAPRSQSPTHTPDHTHRTGFFFFFNNLIFLFSVFSSGKKINKNLPCCSPCGELLKSPLLISFIGARLKRYYHTLCSWGEKNVEGGKDSIGKLVGEPFLPYWFRIISWWIRLGTWSFSLLWICEYLYIIQIIPNIIGPKITN